MAQAHPRAPAPALLPLLFLGSLDGPAPVVPSAPVVALSAPEAERPLHFQTDEHGAPWIRGATYKSSVSPAGAVYIPYLGSDAPRNYPVEFAVRSCSVGDVELDVAGRAVAEHGLSLDLDRGSLVERWTYEQKWAEQSFHFADLPNRGELRLAIAWSSELEPSVDEAGFLWSNELGGVHYGRATALDAAGRKLALSTELVGDEIVVVVPATFVADAKLPLVVDPIVGTVLAIDGSGFNNFTPETVHDATTNSWLVSYSEQFSGADVDVYAMRLNASGSYLQGGYVDNSSASWTGQSVANLNYGDSWLVVATVSNPAPATTNQIKGRLASSSGLAWGPVTTISDSAYDQYNAICAGDPYPFGASSFLVTWKRVDITESIVYRNLLPDGTFVQAGPVTLQGYQSGLQLSGPIDLSKSNSGSFWTVTWMERCNLCPSLDTVHRTGCIEWTGTIAGGVSVPSILGGASTFNTRVSPPLSISDERVVVATVNTISSTPTPTDEIVLKLQRRGSTPSPTPSPTIRLSDLEPRFANRYTISDLEVDGDRFVLSYGSDAAGSPHVVTLAIVDDQLVLAEPSRDLGSLAPVPPNGVGFAASRHDSGGAPGRNLCVWTSLAPGATQTDIVGAFHEPQQGGAWTTFCAGDGSGVACPCGNTGAPGRGCGTSVSPLGSQLYALGVASTSNDTLVLGLVNAPIGVAALFFQGTSASGGGAGVTFGDGVRCVAGSVIRLGIKTTTNGSFFGGVANYPSSGDASITTRGAVPATGAVRLYQAWFRNSASFCTPSTFNLSNGLRVSWLP